MLIQVRKLANKYKSPITLIHHDNKSNTTKSLKNRPVGGMNAVCLVCQL
jgi:hypothetical protein